jgi:hypothetical protein
MVSETQGSSVAQSLKLECLASRMHKYSPGSHPISLGFYVFMDITIVAVGVLLCHRSPKEEG